MHTILRKYCGLFLILVLFSCADDEQPEPPHEVGTWSLQRFVFSDFPNEFSGYEGIDFALNELSFGEGLVFQSYTLELKASGDFERVVQAAGQSIEEDGTWEMVNDVLTLRSDAGAEPWNIDKNLDNDLWLGITTQSSFIPDIYFDTVSQDYIDYLSSLTEAEIDSINNSLQQTISFDLVHVFERED